MKKNIKIPNKISLVKNYVSWGQYFKNNAYLANAAWKYYNKNRKNPTYENILKKHAVFYVKNKNFATINYYDPKLLSHVRKNLYNFQNFRTDFYTFFLAKWNSIYGDYDFDGPIEIIHVEKVLYQRDRLMQLFEACPEGSYGWFAGKGLRPIKFVVRSFAAAEIDKFFASCAHFLKQPFGPSVSNVMTALETYYWDSLEDFLDWSAGQIIGQYGRSVPPNIAARVSSWLSGRRKVELPDGEELTEEDWDEIEKVLLEMASDFDKDATERRLERTKAVYETVVLKNQDKKNKKPWSKMEELD